MTKVSRRMDAEWLLAQPLDDLRPTSREDAETFLGWTFTKAEHRRMAELLKKNAAGEISPEEKQELERFCYLDNRVSILHSRTRSFIQPSSFSM